MFETKIIQITNNPEVMNRANEIWRCFGWSVLSVQITHSQDTKTYTKGLDYYTGNLTVETTTISYATITYQRDTDMPNYARLAALQAEVEALVNERVKPENIKAPKILSNKNYYIAIGIYLIPLVLLMMPSIVRNGGKGVKLPAGAEKLSLPLAILAVAYLVFTYVNGRKKLSVQLAAIEKHRKQEEERCENRKQEIANRLEEIEREARSLTA